MRTDVRLRDVGLLSICLLSTAGLSASASPQGRAAPAAVELFATLQGDWDGAGLLQGGDARFTMHWEVSNGGFVSLAFTSARVSSDGASTPVLSARATYSVHNSAVTGVWLDDRPQRLRVDGVITHSAFVANWTADAERGRTEYEIRSNNEVVVRDIVHSNGSERTFAEATYHRRGTPVGLVTEEVRLMFEADQADRRPATQPTAEMWADITKRDLARRDRVRHLVKTDTKLIPTSELCDPTAEDPSLCAEAFA